MEDTYLTISAGTTGQGTYSEKRSKFLAFAHHVDSEEEAKELVRDYKRRYFDARHVCYAYSIGHSNPLVRMNDDGEPSSTGGKPIMGQIQKAGITDVIVLVVRYYGGVNLGTGPLAVAYKTAAAEAIGSAAIEERQVEETVDFSFPYECMNAVMRIVKDLAPRIVEQQFDNTCRLRLSIRATMAQQLRSRLADTIPFGERGNKTT